MTNTIKNTITMLEMLPEHDQDFAYEFIKKLVLAWDPDYTKLTNDERKTLELAESGEYVNAKDIDWND